MGSVIADLRYAARELRRRPGFALTAVLSLALGIGATSAVFSVVYGVLINPFPYVGADRMMQISLRDNGRPLARHRPERGPDRSAAAGRTVESVVAEDGWNLTTTDGDIPEDVVAVLHLAERAEPLGHSRADGPMAHSGRRASGPGRRRASSCSAISSGSATTPAIRPCVGRTIQLVRKNYQIVGVMPPRFRWREADIYVPLKVRLEPNIYYGVTLKHPPGVSTAAANAELQPILQQFATGDARALPGQLPRAPAQHRRAVSPGRWGRGSICCSAPWRRCC